MIKNSKTFLVDITVNMPYPKTFSYRSNGSSLSVAVSRALKDFRKEVKGKRIKTVLIKATQL